MLHTFSALLIEQAEVGIAVDIGRYDRVRLYSGSITGRGLKCAVAVAEQYAHVGAVAKLFSSGVALSLIPARAINDKAKLTAAQIIIRVDRMSLLPEVAFE